MWNIFRAQYGRRFDERDIGKLIERVLFMIGGTQNRRGIRKLILCYFGVKIPHTEIRQDMACAHAVVTDRRKRVYDALDQIGNLSIGAMEVFMKEKKLVA